MAKRSNQKLKLLYLSKILLENTDERNAMTMSQILRELEKCGVRAERKSIYDDIEALRVFGIDVQTVRDRYVKYYALKNDFDLAELKLIFDLVSASGIVSENKSRELMKKFNVSLDGQLFANDDDRSVSANEDTYKNLSLICNAIHADKKIRFKCFEWNVKKQRVVQFEGEYLILSPIKLMMTDGRYEVLCFSEATNSYASYRLDRMLNLSVVNVGRTKELPNIDIENKTERVILRCDNLKTSDVLEYFGFDVTVLSEREKWFEISVKTKITPSFFAWVFAGEGSVKIIGPEWVKNKYSDIVRKNLNENEEN